MILFKSIFGKRFVLFLLSNFLFFHFGSFWGSLRAETPQVRSGRQSQRVNQNRQTLTPQVRSGRQSQRVNQNRQTFHAGDAVQISVFPDTTSFLNGTFPIDGAGDVTLPMRGKVKITNMNDKEFVQYLNENYSQYLRAPNLQVRPLIRASLIGGFSTPGSYYIDRNATLWQLVRLGGGIVLENGLKRMRWERNNRSLQKNLVPLFESDKSLQEIGFRSGDQIWVPAERNRTFIDRVSQIVPFITVGLSVYTFYLTYQINTRR
ncbi:MAG: polysaccharide biosynthesis/export family protein [Calditrichia bacterium]